MRLREAGAGKEVGARYTDLGSGYNAFWRHCLDKIERRGGGQPTRWWSCWQTEQGVSPFDSASAFCIVWMLPGSAPLIRGQDELWKRRVPPITLTTPGRSSLTVSFAP